ncbi:MAG: PorT family protein [Flavobacteriales bacterium]|nr:PorT family protein [Flavobacteriales bacterium]
MNSLVKFTLAGVAILTMQTSWAQQTEESVIDTKHLKITVVGKNSVADTISPESKKKVIKVNEAEMKENMPLEDTLVSTDLLPDTMTTEENGDVVVNKDCDDKTEKVVTHGLTLELGFNQMLNRAGNFDMPEAYKDLALENTSGNLNIGFVQQGVNIVKGKLRLVYGLGLELNHYRFRKGVTINRESSPMTFEINNNIDYRTNKLVSKYATVPLMLHFKSNPCDEKKSFTIAAGAQFGYLIGSKQKQKWGSGGDKEKYNIKGDYGFSDFRTGYVVQLGYGDFILYGKYYQTPIFKEGRGPEMNTVAVGLVIVPF